MSTSSKVRFAVVGAGAIGEVHARAIRGLPEVAELRLVVSTREATARRLAEAQGATGWSTDYQAVLADPEIDAVAVVSQHRFDPSTERVMAAIQAGHLGRLTSGTASTAWWRGQSYYDSGRWRGTWAMDGGGAIMNQTIHTIDLLVAMLGVPTEVFAYAARLAHERVEVEDTAVAVVRFAGGALGVIHGTTAASPGLDASVRVFGLGAAHRAQFADFVDAIGSQRPVRVGTREARAVLALVLGLYRSAASGTPVPIEHG